MTWHQKLYRLLFVMGGLRWSEVMTSDFRMQEERTTPFRKEERTDSWTERTNSPPDLLIFVLQIKTMRHIAFHSHRKSTSFGSFDHFLDHWDGPTISIPYFKYSILTLKIGHPPNPSQSKFVF